MIRYNNMQVNPDGSLAANQNNESNHNAAKVRMKITMNHRNLIIFLFSNSNTNLAKVTTGKGPFVNRCLFFKQLNMIHFNAQSTPDRRRDSKSLPFVKT